MNSKYYSLLESKNPAYMRFLLHEISCLEFYLCNNYFPMSDKVYVDCLFSTYRAKVFLYNSLLEKQGSDCRYFMASVNDINYYEK